MDEDKKSNEDVYDIDPVDKLFDEVKNGSVEKTIRKNKYIGYVKTILISAIVAVVVLMVVYIAIESINFQYCQEKQLDKAWELQCCYDIGYPNRYLGVLNRYNGLFKAELECQTCKNLNGKILYAGNEKRLFGFFNMHTASEFSGLTSQQLTDDDISVDFKHRQSSIYGLRYMTFFYPYVQYKNGINDFKILDEIAKDRIAEVGISFDKAYTLDEVKDFIPEGLATFYWVDTINQSYKETISKYRYVAGENDINGIKLLNDFGKIVDEPEKRYINALSDLKNVFKNGYYVSIYDILAGSDGNINVSDIRIQGVVVVGSIGEISGLRDKPFIRYATLGSVVDRY